MRLERKALCALIPHAGPMCLLDEVVDWTPEAVHCRSHSHRRQQHPLRRDGVLWAVHGIEYGAQAAAVHGALLARGQGRAPEPGLLAALKGVQLLEPALDSGARTLEVRAAQVLVMGGGRLYEFEVADAARMLVRGRITIMPGAAREGRRGA